MTNQLMSSQSRVQQQAWAPPPMRNMDDTGLNMITISDLALKVLYFGGVMTGSKISDVIKLPFVGILDQIMEFMKREKYVEVRGIGGVGDAALQFIITSKGVDKAKEVLERSQYAGPAPVTLEQYVNSMKLQSRGRIVATPDVMKRAEEHTS